MADMDLFLYRLFFIAPPPKVVSKCALADKQKASLVQREVARQRRDGGIVKVEIRTKTIPQSASLTVPFTQESLRL